MASFVVFAHTALDDAPNYVNCESNNGGYGTPLIFPGAASFLLTVTDLPPGATVDMRIDWYSPDGNPAAVLTRGGPAYVPGTGRYPASGADQNTWKITFQPGASGYAFPTVTVNGEDDYNAYGNVNWLMGTGGGTAWGSTVELPAVAPGPPIGGGTTPPPDPDPIPVIPGDKELGWWVAPANDNNLDSNPTASYGAIVKTSGTGDINRGWPSVYGGVVNPDRREVIWNVASWNPINPGTPAPNIDFPIQLGTLKTPDGVKISNAEQSAQRRFGVLKLRASVGGVYATNLLVLTMAPGNLYGTTAFSTEALPVGAKEFWTGFRNTFESVT